MKDLKQVLILPSAEYEATVKPFHHIRRKFFESLNQRTLAVVKPTYYFIVTEKNKVGLLLANVLPMQYNQFMI
jgi:hypothetical protein